MRARWWLGAAVLAVCLTGPIAESFDWWDQAQPVADDTETNVVFVALSVGLALSVAAIVVQWFASFVSQPTSHEWLPGPHLASAFRLRLHSTGAPHTPLRI